MADKIFVGPITKGLKTNPLAFYIDNESFPTLYNFYQWRGRVKRKRGTALLGRLQRAFSSGSTTITLANDGSGNGVGNILTGFSLQANGNIVPGTVTIIDTTASNTYTEPATPNGTLTGTPSGTGTIDYATGAIFITGAAGDTITAVFNYYPDLPVMGLEDLNLTANQYPGTIGFDTTYSYNILTTNPYTIYDVSFYKNPVTGTYPGYVAKSTQTPTTWNGQDYQQFWTTNYQNAFWATNGITVPFTTTNIGMQYKPIVTVTVTSGGPPAIVSLQIIGHGLVVGDFVFINEVLTTTGINFQTGYVTTRTDANNVVVEFPNATIATNGTGGIAQYLTNRANTTLDSLRWYDGDPTTAGSTKGWVNFAPPLSQAPFGIEDEPAAQYYLVGARMILPFKDRLLFFGPVIQTSTPGSQVYLQDTVIYSQNGTPFYTCSFTGSPTSSTTVFTPILVPTNQIATAGAYFEDSTGFGGFISAGYAQPITSVSPNEDTLIIGFTSRQTRFVYTGNDIVPFNFYIVNSELGTSSAFSIINLDRGVLTIGDHGIIISNQIGSERIDIDIPDQAFQFNLLNNGAQRITAQRDYVNEWVYFTYPSNMVSYNYPNQTLFYNYRDGTWGIFNETYTTYGQFRKVTGETWASIGNVYPTWNVWNDPWNAGTSTLLSPLVIAGNAQGFVFTRDEGTGEANSLYIQSFSGNTVTSPNHCLNNGDYIVISGCLGTIGSIVNGNIYSITNPTANTFTLNPPIGSGTYFGGGLIQRMYVPYLQTKQFPSYWEEGRKTRIGVQQYLLSYTENGQITLLIFLSQNAVGPVPVFPFNNIEFPEPAEIVPQSSPNNSLIYSTVVYTCPESQNLGLTAPNVNLQMVTATPPLVQPQIWHRMNTSLIGDTVQVGITLNEAQMRDTTFSSQFAEIELHGFILDISPSQMLS